jgi:rubredoxin
MNGSFFAGSYGGDSARLAGATRLECPICWYVYDPAEGDAENQIAPGTPFSELPGDWCCPRCGGVRQSFMVTSD